MKPIIPRIFSTLKWDQSNRKFSSDLFPQPSDDVLISWIIVPEQSKTADGNFQGINYGSILETLLQRYAGLDFAVMYR